MPATPPATMARPHAKHEFRLDDQREADGSIPAQCFFKALRGVHAGKSAPQDNNTFVHRNCGRFGRRLWTEEVFGAVL